MLLRQLFLHFSKSYSGNKLRQQKISFLNSMIPLTAEEAALKLKKLKSYEKLSEHEADVISVLIGNCLGDANLWRRGPSCRISFSYSKTSIVYATFLRQFYSSKGLCSSKPLTPFQRKRGAGSDYLEVSFSLFSFKSFNELHKMFYREANAQEKLLGRKFIKIVPPNIEAFLTSLSLAIWLLDDGHCHKHHNTITLATHSFSKEEVEILQKALQFKFGLHFNIQKAKENQFYLYLSKKQVPFFITLVKPYIIPQLYYKIGLDVRPVPTTLGQKAGNDIASLLKEPAKFDESKLANLIRNCASLDSKTGVLKLCTQQRPKNEVLILQQLLKTKFELFFTVRVSTKTSWALFLSKKQLDKLSKQIKPYLQREDYSKIGLKADGTFLLKIQPDIDYYKKFLEQKALFTENDFALLFEERGSFNKKTKVIKLSVPLAYNQDFDLIQKFFFERFNLKFGKNKKRLLANGETQWFLVLSNQQIPVLQKLIQKHITPDKLYKLGL